jgi:hypothetical protein
MSTFNARDVKGMNKVKNWEYPQLERRKGK